MKNISILGSGWLGLPLYQELSKNNDVKLSTRSISKKNEFKNEKVDSFLVDIDSKLDSKEINTFLQSDILIINIPSKNIEGFQKLIKYIIKSSIKKIIFISSTSVCRNRKSPLKIIEKLFQDTKAETTILRFGGLFGYSRNPANFFKNGKIVQNPNAPVNMIHRDDCINIIKEIINQDIFDEVFDCCSPSHPTKKEFYSYSALSSNLSIPIFDVSEGFGTYKAISSEKMIAQLNYEFIYDDLLKWNEIK